MLSTSPGGYALPFEVVSVLLLAAMIGCIVIAMKTPSMIVRKDIEIIEPHGNGQERNKITEKILETEHE
jgi:NADH-quinone oxidoreductase subunit J